MPVPSTPLITRLKRSTVTIGWLAMACAASAKEIVVAQVAPFGGPLAVSGRDFNLGALIAFDEINDKGGVNGNKVRLVSRDDGYRSAETVRLVKEVMDEESPIALLGMWGAENVEAVIKEQLLEKGGMPVVGVRTGVEAFRTNPWLFHVRAGYSVEVRRILDQLQTIGSKRIAVVYEDDGFGREALADAKAGLKKIKLEPALTLALPRNNLDVTQAVQSIVTAMPQAVLLVANTPVAAALIKELKQRRFSTFVFATSTVDAEQLIDRVGADAGGIAVAQGVPNPYKATKPIAAEFQRRVKYLGIDPARANFATLEGYITARVLAEGLKKAGKNPTRSDLVQGLESLKQVDLGGFFLNFGTGQREGSSYVDISIIDTGGRIRQ